MTIIRPSALLLAMTLMGAGSFLHAGETFESHVAKLAHDKFAVRMEAKKSLIELCVKKADLLGPLHRLAHDNRADPEQSFIAKEIIREVFDQAVFVERGAIGFALSRELVVTSVVKDGPAMDAGIERGAQLLSVAGKSVDGKSPGDIYSMVHATKPGTKLEMEFVDKDGEKLLYHPEVAPRSTVRSDENVERRRREAYGEWIELKRKEFETD